MGSAPPRDERYRWTDGQRGRGDSTERNPDGPDPAQDTEQKSSGDDQTVLSPDGAKPCGIVPLVRNIRSGTVGTPNGPFGFRFFIGLLRLPLGTRSNPVPDYPPKKGFHDDVCEAFEKARITGYNIPELVNKEFLKSIGITILGDLGGLSHMFQMILDAGDE